MATSCAAPELRAPARLSPRSFMRVVIVPGNGGGSVRDSNWYAYAEGVLKKRTDIFDEVVLNDMPDPVKARESIWIPYLLDECQCDENTIIIGHSSGAGNSLLTFCLVCCFHLTGSLFVVCSKWRA
jgi:predicted alpha/beta hydrolase family esterase